MNSFCTSYCPSDMLRDERDLVPSVSGDKVPGTGSCSSRAPRRGFSGVPKAIGSADAVGRLQPPQSCHTRDLSTVWDVRPICAVANELTSDTRTATAPSPNPEPRSSPALLSER